MPVREENGSEQGEALRANKIRTYMDITEYTTESDIAQWLKIFC